MAGDPNAGARSPAVQNALGVVDLGRQAATAYERAGPGRRAWRDDPQAAVRPGVPRARGRRVQAGQDRRSSTPCSAPPCAPSTTTSPPRCPPPSATADAAGRGGAARPRRRPADADHRARSARTSRSTRWPSTSPRRPTPTSARCSSVEVSLPRQLLSDGLVLVDTPGVGGLGSAHSAITIGALPMADAVLFVSDATQEFTGPELEFLQTATALCPNVVCVLTKIDFYPAWRKIADLDAGHLEAPRRARADPVPCRRRCASHALRANDRDAQRGVGLPAARQLPARRRSRPTPSSLGVAGRGQRRRRRRRPARSRSSRPSGSALDDPDSAQPMVDNLAEAKAKAERAPERRRRVAADADRRHRRPHGRRRPRPAGPPAPGRPGGRRGPRAERPGRDVGRVRAVALPPGRRGRRPQLRVPAAHGRSELAAAGGRALRRGRQPSIVVDLDVADPTEVLDRRSTPTPTSTCSKMGVGTQGMAALRGTYGGVLMFGMLGQHGRPRPRPTPPPSSSACSWAAGR